MYSRSHRAVSIHDDSHVGMLRRIVKQLAISSGFNDEGVGRAELVATEVATNLVKHTSGGGEVLVAAIDQNGVNGLELIALDSGPGMAAPHLMLEDGVSTAGTLGTGLGAIKRMSDEFDLVSKPGYGTSLLARLWLKRKKPPSGKFDVGGIAVAKPGEEKSGDGWAIVETPQGAIALLIDGLGHGEEAAAAATRCLGMVASQVGYNPKEALSHMHEALHGTRGAAVALAQIDVAEGKVVYCGVGNIAGRIKTKGTAGCISMPGILGYRVDKLKEFTYPWDQEAVLVMNTDGLVTNVDVEHLWRGDAALMAGELYFRHRRGTDDAGVIVVRNRSSLGRGSGYSPTSS